MLRKSFVEGYASNDIDKMTGSSDSKSTTEWDGMGWDGGRNGIKAPEKRREKKRLERYETRTYALERVGWK